MKRVIALAALLNCGAVFAHGLMPQRLEAPSGAQTVIYQFTAVNNYKWQDRYSVECFKHDLKHRAECVSIPTTMVIAPHATRKFKVKLEANGVDDVYLICTVQEPDPDEDRAIITRICASVFVGVDPEAYTVTSKRSKHRAATDAVRSGE